MKKCTYCGLENPDEAALCSTCHTEFADVPQPPAPTPPEHVISQEERRFWEQMTFRQFAVLIVKLQAVWLLFDGAIEATYLPTYFRNYYRVSPSSPIASETYQNFFLMVLRILMHVAAAFALIMYTERILSWLVKDSVSKSPNTAVGPDS